jgi:hypothetical protein
MGAGTDDNVTGVSVLTARLGSKTTPAHEVDRESAHHCYDFSHSHRGPGIRPICDCPTAVAPRL